MDGATWAASVYHVVENGDATKAVADCNLARINGRGAGPMTAAEIQRSAANCQLMAASKDLRAFVEATLLFFGGQAWCDADQRRWVELTGKPECDSASLCAFGREVLAKAGAA